MSRKKNISAHNLTVLIYRIIGEHIQPYHASTINYDSPAPVPAGIDDAFNQELCAKFIARWTGNRVSVHIRLPCFTICHVRGANAVHEVTAIDPAKTGVIA